MTDLSVFRDKEAPACWRVEDNDYDNDGGCTLTIFAGQDAETGARIFRMAPIASCKAGRGWRRTVEAGAAHV